MDPLLLHRGYVEVEQVNEDDKKIRADADIRAGLPSSKDTSSFLYRMRLPGLIANSILVFLYITSFIRLAFMDPQNTDPAAEASLMIVPIVLLGVAGWFYCFKCGQGDSDESAQPLDRAH